MDVRGTVEKATDELKTTAAPALRAASDPQLRRHVRSSADHALAAGRRINGRRRRAGIAEAVSDRRAQRHLRASARQLGKAKRRLAHHRSARLKSILLGIGAGLGAYAIVPRILRRLSDAGPGQGETSTYTPSGLGSNGALRGDVTTGGDPFGGTAGGQAAQALADRAPDDSSGD